MCVVGRNMSFCLPARTYTSMDIISPFNASVLKDMVLNCVYSGYYIMYDF